ncbi:MAG: CRTAC1 family protein [Pirellulaceae bacterium]
MTLHRQLANIILFIFFSAAAGCGPSPSTVTTTPKATVPATLPGTGNSSAGTAHASSIKFTDVTKSAGIDFTYKNDNQKMNRAILESVGGGQGMFDFDRDGLLDILHVGGGLYRGPLNKELGGYPSALYRNRGNWKFDNVSQPAGGFAGDRFKHGCTAADYDNDGFQDVLICGYGGVQLWRNMGDGNFEEGHAASLLADKLWSTTGAFGDFNQDGNLDLYVAHYVDWSFQNDPHCVAADTTINKRETCPPKAFKALSDTLYVSNGDGTFRDASASAGLKPDGKGLAVLTADLDLDGDQDIYVCNDTTENFLYLNDGTGKFEEDAALRGCAVDHKGIPNGSMGTDLADFNHDGLPDIWVANYERETFAMYQNDGRGFFRHVSEPLGITAIGSVFVGFGTMFVDLDRDGFEDLVVNNGHVQFHPREIPVRQVPLILMNQQGKSYDPLHLGDGSYLDAPHLGRGFAVGDLDNDGDYDFGFTNNDEPSALLRNDSTDGNSWLRVRLIGRAANRDGIGARLVLETATEKLMRFVKSGASYTSHSDDRPLFAFPKGTKLESLTIHWPSGTIQKLAAPQAGDELTIVEPAVPLGIDSSPTR